MLHISFLFCLSQRGLKACESHPKTPLLYLYGTCRKIKPALSIDSPRRNTDKVCLSLYYQVLGEKNSLCTRVQLGARCLLLFTLSVWQVASIVAHWVRAALFLSTVKILVDIKLKSLRFSHQTRFAVLTHGARGSRKKAQQQRQHREQETLKEVPHPDRRGRRVHVASGRLWNSKHPTFKSLPSLSTVPELRNKKLDKRSASFFASKQFIFFLSLFHTHQRQNAS